jgi:Family of unknown function (DUF5808)
MKKLKRTVAAVVFGVTAAAIAQELSKPEEEREWHGTVAGTIPYDFRVPTFDRLVKSWWNPKDERIFTDRVFGVGWAINLAQVSKALRDNHTSV